MANMKTADKVIEIAKAKVGYKEGYDFNGKYISSGYSVFGQWYGDKFGGGASYWAVSDWCAMFCAWCLVQAGMTSSETIFTASAGDSGVSMWKNKGYWHNKSGYTPKVGDLIHFTWGHVGIVSKVTSSTVYTIEGNTRVTGISQDCVGEHSYSLSYTGIRGYASPKYTAAGVSASTTVTTKPTIESTKVNYTGKVNAVGGLNVRSGPSASYSRIGSIANGSTITITKESDNWGYVSAKGGWVCLDYVKKVTSSGTAAIDVSYQVYGGGRWFSWIKNFNNTNANGYAGLDGIPISGIRAGLSKGKIKYRVHTTGGKWYSWITDYNTKNDMGYAGVLGASIDMVQMQLVGLDGYNVKYRVSTTSSNGYLPWVVNYNTYNDNGYAGIPGQAIDKLQIQIVAK